MPRQVYLGTLVQAGGIIVASLIGGRLSDRAGRRKPFVVAAAIIYAAAMFVIAAAHSFDGFLVGMAIGGLGFGLYLAVDLALVADVVSHTENGKDLGVFNIANALPFSLAPAVAPLILAAADGNYGVLYAVAGELRPARGGRDRAGQPRPVGHPAPCRGGDATQLAIWARVANPSLSMMLRTCVATVRSEMNRRAAICLLVRPSPTSRATSTSRGASGPVGSGSATSPGWTLAERQAEGVRAVHPLPRRVRRPRNRQPRARRPPAAAPGCSSGSYGPVRPAPAPACTTAGRAEQLRGQPEPAGRAGRPGQQGEHVVLGRPVVELTGDPQRLHQPRLGSRDVAGEDAA